MKTYGEELAAIALIVFGVRLSEVAVKFGYDALLKVRHGEVEKD